jgi:hypothetical protein
MQLEYTPTSTKRKMYIVYPFSIFSDEKDGVELLAYRRTLVEALGYQTKDISTYSFSVINKGKVIGKYVWHIREREKQ